MLRVLSLSEVWKLFFLSAMLMIPHFKTCVHTQKYIHICIILPASKEFPCPCFKTINISVYKATLLTEEHWNISLVFQSNLLGFINSFQQGCLRKRFMRPIVKQKLVLNSMYTSWKSYQLQKELKKNTATAIASCTRISVATQNIIQQYTWSLINSFFTNANSNFVSADVISNLKCATTCKEWISSNSCQKSTSIILTICISLQSTSDDAKVNLDCPRSTFFSKKSHQIVIQNTARSNHEEPDLKIFRHLMIAA